MLISLFIQNLFVFPGFSQQDGPWGEAKSTTLFGVPPFL